MTYQGTVKNGVVIFSGATPAEGARVRVEAIDEAEGTTARTGDPRAVAAAGVTWAGDPEELDRLLDEVQQLREEDLQWERRQGAGQAE
jgi:alkanesulfonate monooxygenase SsuD/methylene tetrahydromethanopterin reductase-like flavin-dependent oxidoreductase (luciferase family)